MFFGSRYTGIMKKRRVPDHLVRATYIDYIVSEMKVAFGLFCAVQTLDI